MTERIYDAIWEFVQFNKSQVADYENKAVAMFDLIIQNNVITRPRTPAEISEVYECIDSALKNGTI